MLFRSEHVEGINGQACALDTEEICRHPGVITACFTCDCLGQQRSNSRANFETVATEAIGDEEGTSSIRIMFDDSFENTREGGTFQGLLKIGLNSVYVMWEVEVKPDKEYLKELKKQEKEAEKQRKKEEAEAKKKAEADAKAEQEAKVKAEAEAEAKAEEEAEIGRAHV